MLLILLGITTPQPLRAASGSPTAASPMAGNGHNVSFDGRIYIVRQTAGWMLMVLRPERVRYAPGGIPILNDGAFTGAALIQPPTNDENALAICERDADSTPYTCNDAGTAGAGPYACYDFVIIDSNAAGGMYNGLRQRDLKVWIANAGTSDAALHKVEWGAGMPPVRAGGVDMRGIEPTVTRDGRLLVYQGHPDNDGSIDILMYATNTTACAADGWDGPHSISHMFNDPRVRGTYRLAERQFRAADGTPYPDRALFRGAYPWLFPDGDAITFTGVTMPCRSPENPAGCGPRRNGLSVIGYPTNWGLAHIDGAVNPSTTDTVRLFFSSPAPSAFAQLPVTGGTDVWPFFGSNTSNYTELVFDDGLDGQYAGVWHMNENINVDGNLDRARTPDTSGYFNTGNLMGPSFPDANNGLFGKALVFGGDGDVVAVPHDASLDPVNGLSVEMWIRPAAPVDCDGNNNYRFLLGKGNIADGSYSLVFEEGERFQARVRTGGVQRTITGTRAIPVGEWSHIGFTYDGATGEMRFFVNGEMTDTASHPAMTLTGSTSPLFIGGPGGARAACPNGDGSFQGDIDEVRISRTVRDLTFAPRPGNDARFVSQWTPPAEAGQPYEVQITYRNIGTTAWSPGTMHKLGSEGPRDNGVWGTGRVELPRVVQPGQQVTIIAALTAPATPGTYPMQWGMVQEGAEWFGPPSDAVDVEVFPLGMAPDAGPPPDAGSPDAGGGDAGGIPDAGTTDADGVDGGSPDASVIDAAAGTDASGGDGGAGADAGGGGGGGCAVEASSAGASSFGASSFGASSFGLLLFAFWRRRRAGL